MKILNEMSIFPKNMVETQKIVTAAIIRKNNKILISQRKNNTFFEPNKWEFPGGKLEPSETYEESLIREIKEELNIKIKIDKLFLKTTHTYIVDNQEFPVNIFSYLTDWISGKVQNIECQDSKWIDIKDIKKYDFVAGDIPIADKLLDL